MARIIGIRHRVKQTKDGEARPTQFYILMGPLAQNEDLSLSFGLPLDLEDDNAELDWVRGTFPVSFRAIQPDEDLSAFSPRHIKWRPARKTDDLSAINPAHRREIEGKIQIANKVPDAYAGIEAGDVYAMSLGGSGDRLAFALSKAGEKVGATVLRMPPSILKERRGDANKDEDAKLLANLAHAEPDLFHEVTVNGRAIILVRETQALRIDAMKARIACEQRLRQTLIGQVFCREGDFAELDIEAQFEALKANDRILLALMDEEDRRIKDLDRAIKQTAVWQRIFDGVTGIGPALAGRLISAIGGIERFMVEPDQARMDALYQESVRLERDAELNDLKQYVQPSATSFDTLRRVASWCAQNGRPDQAAMLERAVECHQERSRLRQKAKRSTQAKLKSFCGVAVMPDGRFPRRRAGELASWHPEARQALYLFADQVNRQGDRTRWGKLLLEYKQKLRAAHPECHKPSALVNLYNSLEKRFGNLSPKPINFVDLTAEAVLNYFETGIARLPPSTTETEREGRGKWIQDVRTELSSPTMTSTSGPTYSRYTDGHIHKMALWRTVTKFTEWLADEWSKLAREQKLEAARARHKK